MTASYLLEGKGYVNQICINLSHFIEVSGQEDGRSCIGLLGYRLWLRFCDFIVGFRNCSDSVIFSVLVSLYFLLFFIVHFSSSKLMYRQNGVWNNYYCNAIIEPEVCRKSQYTKWNAKTDQVQFRIVKK